MKKVYLLLAALCCMIFSAQAQTLDDEVSIMIGTVSITQANKDGITNATPGAGLAAGTITYDDENHILTMDKVKATFPIAIDASSGGDKLVTIKVIGECSLSATNSAALSFTAGDELVIEGDNKASLSIQVTGSVANPAVLCAISTSASDWADFFPLTIKGGMTFVAINPSAGAGIETIWAKELTLDNVNGGLNAKTGFIPVKAKDVDVMNVDILKHNLMDPHVLTIVAYTKQYPVWINGFRLNDGLYSISSAYIDDFYGTATYEPETHTLWLDNVTFTAYVDPDIHECIRIENTEDSEPITIKATKTSGVNILKALGSGQYGIKALTELVIDLNGKDLTVEADDSGIWAYKNVTIQSTAADNCTFTLKSNNYEGIFTNTTSPAPKLTLDNCTFEVTGKEEPIYGFDLDTIGLALDDNGGHYAWNPTKQVIENDGSTLVNATVTFNQTGWKLFALTNPVDAGNVVIKDGATVEDNPYKYSANKTVTMTAEANAGWAFSGWEDEWPIDPTNNPRSIDLTTGTSEIKTAKFGRVVETDEPYYMIEATMSMTYKVNEYASKLRGSTFVSKGELPLASGSTLDRALFADGKIFWVERTSSTATGIYYTTFEEGTLGSTANVVLPPKDVYQNFKTFAFNYADNCFYAMAENTASVTKPLIKITLAGEITEVGFPADTKAQLMAFDKDGKLYYLAGDMGNFNLYTVNTATAELTKVIKMDENLGISTSAYEDCAMAFDPNTNELIYQAGGGTISKIFLLYPETGKGDWIENNGNFYCRGLFTTTEPVKKYNISVAVAAGQSERGDVNINGGGKTGAFAEGTTITLNAVAKETWKFEKWDDDDTNASRSFTVGTEDKSFTASFIQDPDYEPYPVWVGEKRLYNGKKKLTSSDYAAITAGSIELDPATNILTLDNLKMTVTGSKEGIKIEPETAGGNYRIIVAGDCQINADIQALNLRKCSSVTLEAADATAKLTLKGSSGIDFVGPAVEIKGLQVIAQGTAYGITSDKNTALTITGAKVEAKGTSTGSVYEIGSLVLNYCSITAPTGAKFSEENNQVEVTAGVATKDNVVFTPWPKLSVKPVQEGTGSFTLKPEEGESFENEGWFKSGTKVTITANPASGFDFAYWNEGGYSTESEKEYTTTASDKQFSALFYFKAQSTANWYGVNDNKYVKFSLKDHGEEVAKSSTSGSGVKAGDFVDSRWIYVDGTTVKSRDFSNLEDGEALEDATDIKTGAPSGVTDMAYDLKRKIMYAVVGKDLYSVDDEGKAEKLGALKYNTSDVLGIAIAVDANSAIYILAKDGTDGKLYTVKDIDTEGSKVNLAIVGEESNEGKVGATVLDEEQSIAFDHVTGELIWGAPDYLRVIDLATAKAYIAGALKLSKGSQKAIKAMHRMDKMVKVNVQVADGQSSRGTAAVGSGEAQSASVLVGANATIVATPKSGYQFKCWKILDDTEVASTNASFTFTVKKKVTYVAYFEEKPESIDNVNLEAAPMQKLLIDGQLYIIRDGRIYNAAGQLVK